MGAPPPAQGSHKLRHYIIMTTVVIVGLFVLLLFNNDADSFGFTSAVIENVRNSSLVETINNVRGEKQDSVEKIVPSVNDIEFLLLSSLIPTINKETRIGTLNLVFNDLSTAITVNGDKLELNGLTEVVLVLDNFVGQLEINEAQLSLNGVAKQFKVNGISLSSQNEIKIAFSGLNYQKIAATGAELKDLEFVSGEGSVQVGDRLKYGLESGQVVTFYNY